MGGNSGPMGGGQIGPMGGGMGNGQMGPAGQGEQRWRKWIGSMSIGRRWRHVAVLSRRYRSFRHMFWSTANVASPGCRVAQTPVVGGDAYSASIAASSIVAKVTRDSLMMEYGRLYPAYGFERHKGYATAAHITALGRLGPLALHRRSYTPVWNALGLKPQLEFWGDPGQLHKSQGSDDNR
jgi:Ribonuclease HII